MISNEEVCIVMGRDTAADMVLSLGRGYAMLNDVANEFNAGRDYVRAAEHRNAARDLLALAAALTASHQSTG